MKEKFYVTTAIAYANAKPHIGHVLEFVQADVLARYNRLMGKDVFFLTGTDEHGAKLDQVARDKGISPKELVDTNAVFFKELKNDLNLSYDHFVRTTDEDHKKAAQKVWLQLCEKGDIYKKNYSGLYCVGCEAFVLEKDLVDGKCPNHDKAPEVLNEENYFFALSKYTDQILSKIESDELKIVPVSRKNEIVSLLKEGLKDVSFSRPKSVLKWGIDVPNDKDHVMYVWCDALVNYISALGYADNSELFNKFWPANVHLIGKDILRFHAAIWIGMLLSLDLPLPKAIYVHGYVMSEGRKMSKSLNNVIDGYEYLNKYGVDALRYFLMRELPTTEDGDFSNDRFKIVYASELANTFGNLVSRVVAMTEKYFEGLVPEIGVNNGLLAAETENLWKKYDDSFAGYDLKAVLEAVAAYGYLANKYVDENKPWALAKAEDKTELKNVIYNLLEMIRQIALMLAPFLPLTSQKILKQIGFETLDYDRKWGLLKVGQKVSRENVGVLFAPVEG